jgi:hypothetical protein
MKSKHGNIKIPSGITDIYYIELVETWSDTVSMDLVWFMVFNVTFNNISVIWW